VVGLDVDAFAVLPSLVTLQLDGNTIDSFPPQFFASMRQLENISLSFNRLELFDDVSFSVLARLRRVDLSHNAVGGAAFIASRIFAASSGTTMFSGR